MAISIADNFTSGYKTNLWHEFRQDPAIEILSANGQVETTYLISGSYNQSAGLVSRESYDLYLSSSIAVDITKLSGGTDTAGFIYISPQQVPLTGATPDSNSDWYRFGTVGNTWYAQKRVNGGAVSTIATGPGGGTVKQYKIDLPTSGAQVRFLINNIEQANDPLYDLGERQCFVHLASLFGSTAGINEVDFDNFLLDFPSLITNSTRFNIRWQYERSSQSFGERNEWNMKDRGGSWLIKSRDKLWTLNKY